jgi:ABC-2 type transport system permease protein
MRVVLGFGAGDLSKISVYFGMLFLYLLLMATIHAAMLGAGILAKEERDKTSEFLFTKPVSRRMIITAKLLVAFVNVLVFNLVTLLSSVILVGQYNKAGEHVNGNIAVLMVGMFILQLLFMVIGSAIAAVKRKPKTAASLASGILLLTYLLSIVIDLANHPGVLKYFTPFKYFEAKNIMSGSGLDAGYIVLSAVLIVVLTAATYAFYNKRDLNV